MRALHETPVSALYDGGNTCGMITLNHLRRRPVALRPSCSRSQRWCSKVTMVLVQKIDHVSSSGFSLCILLLVLQAKVAPLL